MARKSKQQRISEGLALIASIKQDPVLAKEQSWLLRFLNDLVTKFQRGKGGTSRQRTLFDEKIADGVPARKVNTHVAQPDPDPSKRDSTPPGDLSFPHPPLNH